MDAEKKQAAVHRMGRLCGVFEKIASVIVSVYMILIIVVMPFYFQEGYNHIGSDKAYFFRVVTGNTAKVFLPVLALYLFCRTAVRVLSGVRAAAEPRTVEEGCIRPRLSATDLFALLYLSAVLLSYWGSAYKDTALWGTAGWYMGTVPQLFLVGIYFAVSRFWRTAQIFYLFLPVSAVVFLLGFCNRFGWYPLPMENAELPFFISTIGNINWYCGYLTAVFFTGAVLFRGGAAKRRTAAGLAYMAAGFATLVTQGSDSGIFAFAAAFGVMFVCASAAGAADGAVRMICFWRIMLTLFLTCIAVLLLRNLLPGRMDFTSRMGNLLTYSMFPAVMSILSAGMLLALHSNAKHALLKTYVIISRILCFAVPAAVLLFAGMTALNTLRPGSLGRLSEMEVFTFDLVWGSRRGTTWRAGAMCFLEQDPLHKLIGVGPDCMWDYISRDGSGTLFRMVQDVFGRDRRLTNAHCEWLTVLVNTGICGLAGYAGMMASAVLRYLRCAYAPGHSRSAGERAAASAAGACGLCLLTYAANGVWSFQQSMGAATVFIVLGIGEAEARKSKKLARMQGR